MWTRVLCIRRLLTYGRGQAGFTLVEVLTASVLLLVVLAAVYGIWFGLQRTYTFADEDMTAQSEARAALSEMIEFIRTAREPDAGVPGTLDLVIAQAQPNVLICWTDVDRDPSHDLELVRFRVDTATRTLYRDTSEDASDPTFANGASVRLVGSWVSNDDDSPLFTYVGANGASLAMATGADPLNPAEMATYVVDPTLISEVRIDLKVDVVVGDKPEYHELTSTVQPRNLRTY
jgi:prepilin-type N-terminal cleavage/methylation domain-containing protein